MQAKRPQAQNGPTRYRQVSVEKRNRITESRSHRIIWVGWNSTSPTALQGAGTSSIRSGIISRTAKAQVTSFSWLAWVLWIPLRQQVGTEEVTIKCSLYFWLFGCWSALWASKICSFCCYFNCCHLVSPCGRTNSKGCACSHCDDTREDAPLLPS